MSFTTPGVPKPEFSERCHVEQVGRKARESVLLQKKPRERFVGDNVLA